MKFTSLSTILFILASEASKAWAEVVTGVVEEIKIKPKCTSAFSGEMTNIAYTIKPIDGSETKISSTPEGLVAADYDSSDKELKLKYTSVALSTDHSSAAVTIEVPKSQLKEVTVGGQVTATVLDGFGSQFKEASAENQARLFVTASSPNKFQVDAEDQAQVTAKVNGTPTKLEVEAENQSSVSIQGAITQAKVKDQGRLTFLSGSSYSANNVKAKGQGTVVVDSSVSGGCTGVVKKDITASCTTSSTRAAGFAGEANGTGTSTMTCKVSDVDEISTKYYLRQTK